MGTKTADLVRASRTNAGLSKYRLAKLMGLSSGSFISRIEEGIAPMPVLRIDQICEITGVSREKLVQAIEDDHVFLMRSRCKPR